MYILFIFTQCAYVIPPFIVTSVITKLSQSLYKTFLLIILPPLLLLIANLPLSLSIFISNLFVLVNPTLSISEEKQAS